MDSNDYPHISYSTAPPVPIHTIIRYCYFNGTEWIIETVVNETNIEPSYNSIALDSYNHPHICYFEDFNSHLLYVYWNGTDWIREIVDNFNLICFYNSISIDSNNSPHISYYAVRNNNLMYAKKIENQPPVADFDYSPVLPNANYAINFYYNAYDPVGNIVNYRWSFGDGHYSSYRSPSHSYSTNGLYTASLTVTDDCGINNTHSKIVPVGLDVYCLQNLSSGWNFISLPFNESIDKNNLLLRYGSYFYDVGYLFGWNRLIQSYEFADVLFPGYGYWLYSSEDGELWIVDIHNDYGTYITTIEEGWNIMGIPYYIQVDKTDVQVDDESWNTAVSSGWISDYVFGWNPLAQSYEFTDTFDPGQAYWLYAYQNCVLKRQM